MGSSSRGIHLMYVRLHSTFDVMAPILIPLPYVDLNLGWIRDCGRLAWISFRFHGFIDSKAFVCLIQLVLPINLALVLKQLILYISGLSIACLQVACASG